ncbi:MAG: beta-lactamase family protein [Acidobacteria bacterium]|nr:beta-lactamase family protein [Acidobacteriota bacterium]
MIIFILVGFLGCADQQEATPDQIIADDTGAGIDARLTPYLQQALTHFDLPGLAVGIVQDGQVVYARGFGFESLANRQPVTIRTLFHMASISKPFVATAVMQLVEEGEINLDDPVTKYLPYFRLQGHDHSQITIRQMLTHTSGMPDVEDYQWDKPVYDEGALERYVRSLADQQPVHPPGETFRYSNMAFECLGDLIGKVSGMTFADYVKQNILDPSGMTASTFLKPEHLPELWAAPHLRTLVTFTWDGYPYNRMHGPSSTLHSSALEMCRWAEINMNRGERAGQRILPAVAYDELWRPQADAGRSRQVGLSWFIGEYKGEKTISHGGGDVGFNTMLVMLPERKTAVVVLCNFIPAPVEMIAYAAVDILLGQEPPQLRPPLASLKVLAELKTTGREAAVQLWHSLYQTDPEGYDFSPQQFFQIMQTAVLLDREADAADLARFIRNVLPENALSGAVSVLAEYAAQNPQNRAAAAALQIFQSDEPDPTTGH